MTVVLTPAETLLASRIGFDEKVLRLVKGALGKDTIEPYLYGDLAYGAEEEADGKGFTVRLADTPHDETWHLDEIYEIRSLLPSGYSAFSTDDYMCRPSMTVLKTDDPDEIIRVQDTRGWDFKDQYYTSDDLIRVLADWQQKCTLDVVGAGSDNVKMILNTLPDNLVAFAEEVNHLCWELDQINHLGHYGDGPEENRALAEKLAESLRETRRLYLWWD